MGVCARAARACVHLHGMVEHCTVLDWCNLQELVNSGALVSIENKFGETPLDRSEAALAQILQGTSSCFCLYLVLPFL